MKKLLELINGKGIDKQPLMKLTPRRRTTKAGERPRHIPPVVHRIVPKIGTSSGRRRLRHSDGLRSYRLALMKISQRSLAY